MNEDHARLPQALCPAKTYQPASRFDAYRYRTCALRALAIDVPIAVCKGAFSIFRAMDLVRREAADIISSDPTSMGGILEFKKLCGLTVDIPVVAHASWSAIT